MSRKPESPPGNANGQRELAGCGNQNYAGKLMKKARGVKALREVSQRGRHPVRPIPGLSSTGFGRLKEMP